MDTMKKTAEEQDSEIEAATADPLQLLRQQVAGQLSDYRMAHTLSVEQECRALARYFALDEDSTRKLCVAALLHDITKEKKGEEQLALCRELGITLRADEIASPNILHARTGAELARRQFPELVDEAVYNAIWRHTTGARRMNLYDRLLYLADYIEPQRKFDSCVKLREYFYSRKKTENRFYLLRDAILLSLEMTVGELSQAKEPICLDTVEAWNGLIEEKNHQRPEKTGKGEQ